MLLLSLPCLHCLLIPAGIIALHVFAINCDVFPAGRVRHMKGLLDVPICVVEDNYERRLVFSAPTGEDYSTHYRPPGNTRYSANKNKHIPAIGIGESISVYIYITVFTYA